MKKALEIMGNCALVVVLIVLLYVSFKHDENQRVHTYSGVVK